MYIYIYIYTHVYISPTADALPGGFCMRSSPGWQETRLAQITLDYSYSYILVVIQITLDRLFSIDYSYSNYLRLQSFVYYSRDYGLSCVIVRGNLSCLRPPPPLPAARAGHIINVI